MKIPERQDILVLPADNPKGRPIGWVIKETIGISCINTWPLKPWYKKIFYKKFWNNLRLKLFYRKSKMIETFDKEII